MYAFFNGTEDRDIKAPLPTQMTGVQQKESELTLAKRKYVELTGPDLEAWASKVAALPDIWFVPQQEDYDLPTFGANNGANLYPQEDGSFLVTGMVENKTHYIMMLNTKLQGITGMRVEPMTDEMLPKMGPGWAPNGNFVLTELHVESASLKEVNNLQTNSLQAAYADYSQEGFPIAATIDGVTTNGGWAVDLPHLPMHAVDRCAVFVTKENIGYEGGMRLKVSLVQHHGQSHTLGRVRVSYTTADRETLAAQAVPQRIRDLAKIPAGERTLDQKVALKRYYQATFQPHSTELAAYSKAMAESPGVKGEVQAQTLVERRLHRPTHVHVRGNFLDKGAEVQPDTLAVLHQFKPRSPRPSRIDLADWITDPANPLTARVAVNRLWMHLFGEGLVTTVADFGRQGEKPSHPELLDWLATEFMRLKWSRKAMIKLIVTSATYRQSSDSRDDLRERDAKNKLLARQNRFRLSAENARDQYLAASGLLDGDIGGPSVTPETKRRGLYLQFKRSFPDYMLTTFDAPSSTVSCPMRERSNTPLQALTLLNDQNLVKCARALAERAVKEKPTDTAGRMQQLFQLVLARRPTAEELGDLTQVFTRLREIYQADSEKAKKVAGDFKSAQLPEAEAASWTVLARTVLNLDELITRE